MCASKPRSLPRNLYRDIWLIFVAVRSSCKLAVKEVILFHAPVCTQGQGDIVSIYINGGVVQM